jgi:hypothetical protein
MKYDVVDMLTWFVSMVLPGMQKCMSVSRTGKHSLYEYAEAEIISKKVAIGVKATVSAANDWFILSLVAEGKTGDFFTLSLSGDRGNILLAREQGGFYAEYYFPSTQLDEIPWDSAQYEVEKALYKRM